MPQRVTALGIVWVNWLESGWHEATGGRHAVDGDNGPALIDDFLGCTYFFCTRGVREGLGPGYTSHEVTTGSKALEGDLRHGGRQTGSLRQAGRHHGASDG